MSSQITTIFDPSGAPHQVRAVRAQRLVTQCGWTTTKPIRAPVTAPKTKAKAEHDGDA